jgi:DNA replication licensing factor MCM6
VPEVDLDIPDTPASEATPEPEGTPPATPAPPEKKKETRYYVAQIHEMQLYDYTVMYVDYRHLLAREPVLAHAVLEQYYRSVPFPTSPHLCKLTDRFLPFMRRAVQSLVRKYEPTFLYTSASLSTNQNSSASTSSLQTRDFYIAFHNMPLTSGIRDMRMDKIGQLASISGTVTRTSEVRPELISGTFSCEMCQTTIRDVEQQFKYTEVGLTWQGDETMS